MTRETIFERGRLKRLMAVVTLMALMLTVFASAGVSRAYADDGKIELKVGRNILLQLH